MNANQTPCTIIVSNINRGRYTERTIEATQANVLDSAKAAFSGKLVTLTIEGRIRAWGKTRALISPQGYGCSCIPTTHMNGCSVCVNFHALR